MAAFTTSLPCQHCKQLVMTNKEMLLTIKKINLKHIFNLAGNTKQHLNSN